MKTVSKEWEGLIVKFEGVISKFEKEKERKIKLLQNQKYNFKKDPQHLLNEKSNRESFSTFEEIKEGIFR